MNINLDTIYNEVIVDDTNVIIDASHAATNVIIDASHAATEVVIDASHADTEVVTIDLSHVTTEVTTEVTTAAAEVTVAEVTVAEVTIDASRVADTADTNVTKVLILPDKKANIVNIIKNTLIHEFKNKFQVIDKINMFNLLIRCIELMKNTDIRPENQCHTSLEIIIHILETNALNVTTCPRFITIIALKHDIHKLSPLLNKIQEVMVMVDTLHVALQTVLHAYLSA